MKIDMKKELIKFLNNIWDEARYGDNDKSFLSWVSEENGRDEYISKKLQTIINTPERVEERIIAVDFDGTCVTHDYPRIGKDIGAKHVLEQLVGAGHKLILNTMRCGKELEEAVDWFKKNELPLFGINENPTQKSWTSSPKPYANIYIDDAALGCPLIYNPNWSRRPFVDWSMVEKDLIQKGLI